MLTSSTPLSPLSPTILHLSEDFPNLSRSPMNSNLSPGEIETRSRLEPSYQPECTIYAFPSLHLRRTFIYADYQTCPSLSNFMTSRRTHYELTLTLQLTGSIQSTYLQLTVQASPSRAYRTPSSASTNWMHTSCWPKGPSL